MSEVPDALENEQTQSSEGMDGGSFPDWDSDDEYFDISADILENEINPSRPPSPTASVPDEPVEDGEEEEEGASESPFVLRTRALHAELEQLSDEDIEEKMLHILGALDETGLDVALFLDVLCWGKPCAVRNPRIRYAR